MIERMLASLRRNCEPEPAALLRPDPERPAVPHAVQDRRHRCRSKYGILVSFAFQSLPGYLFGISAQYALTGVSGPSGSHHHQPAQRRRHGVADLADHALQCLPRQLVRRRAASVGALVDPGMTVASLYVPLVAPMTEYGDRINQLDLNISKTFRVGRARSSRSSTSSTC